MSTLKITKLANILSIPRYFEEENEVYLFSPVLHANEAKVFKPFWIGPFKIIRIVYRIQHMVQPSIQLSVHASGLRKKFENTSNFQL